MRPLARAASSWLSHRELAFNLKLAEGRARAQAIKKPISRAPSWGEEALRAIKLSVRFGGFKMKSGRRWDFNFPGFTLPLGGIARGRAVVAGQ